LSRLQADVLEALAINIHRIDKDVARCDRNHPYFTQASLDASANLYRLRTIMCTWTWQHLETGYVQGMCDLLAPLLVILDDEALAHACFCQLMQTMLANFPLPGPSSGGVVSPSQLERVIDPVIASHMHLSEENAHLYFYRWFLLDFKRELKYDDVFRVWETIWTARRLVTHDFGVFLAFALIQCYRDIILFYCVDYTDIIRFYNGESNFSFCYEHF
uniref:Rab-GAP TBC domain-containing protein n=1 Tax=Schistocephalus solidus TaxID=70667 RepID=A0A183SHP6_SCHSO